MADCDIFIYGETEVSYLKKRDIVEQNWFAKKRGEIESNLIPLLRGGCSPPITGEVEGVGAQRTGW